MKHREAPACPRCNRNDEVRKVANELAHLPTGFPVRDGYVLAGTVIRPDNYEWYCEGCAESFAVPSEHWGKPLTESLQ